MSKRTLRLFMPGLILVLSLLSPFSRATVYAQDAITKTHLPILFFLAAGPSGSGTLSISTASTSKNELDSGSTFYTFTVGRTGQTASVTTVDYAVSSSGAGAAISPDDFAGGLLPSGQIWFGSGEASRTLIIRVQGDSVVEPDEGFQVRLYNPSGGAVVLVGKGAAASMIRNDDETPSTDLAIVAQDSQQDEGNDTATTFAFKVERTGIIDVETTIDYAVLGVNAAPASDDDFAGGLFPTGQLTFAPNEVERTVTIEVQGDPGVEDDEEFSVHLDNVPSGANVITNDATAQIMNDDWIDLAISVAEPDKPEGNVDFTEFSFIVTRNGDTGGSNSVDYSLQGTEAFWIDDADYFGGVTPSGTLFFDPGQTERLLSILIAGDTQVEQNEDFLVTISNPTGDNAESMRILGPTAVADVRNDDALVPTTLTIAPEVMAASETLKEGGAGVITPFSFIVTRSGNTDNAANVNYFVRGDGDNPANGADFEGGNYPLDFIEFAAGAPFGRITVPVRGDLDSEEDEGFMVILEGPSDGALIGEPGGATGLITDDDGWNTTEQAAISTIVDDAGRITEPAAKDTPTNQPAKVEQYYRYTYQEHDVIGNSESIANFGKDDDILWVGNLYRGDAINNYAYQQIKLPRLPYTISLSLETAQSTRPANPEPPVKIAATVVNPSLSAERAAIKAIVDNLPGISPAAAVTFESEQIFSEEHLTAFAKSNVEYGDFSFEGNFDWSSDSMQTKIVAKYEQVYFTVDMDTPQIPSDLFDANRTTVAEIGTKLDGSKPLYLSSMSYGLVAYLFIESNEKASKVEAAMKFASDGAVDAEVEGGGSAQSVLKNSKIRIVVYGGASKGLAGNLQDYEGFMKVVGASASYGPDSPGKPIAYRFRRLVDDSAAMTTFATKYVEVRALPIRQLVRITAKSLKMNYCNDSPSGGDVEIDRITVSVTGYSRRNIVERGDALPVAYPVQTSAPDVGMCYNTYTFTANPVYLEFSTIDPYTWEYTNLDFGTYARDYDTVGNDEHGYGSRTIMQSDWFAGSKESLSADQQIPVASGSEFGGYYTVNIALITPLPKPYKPR